MKHLIVAAGVILVGCKAPVAPTAPAVPPARETSGAATAAIAKPGEPAISEALIQSYVVAQREVLILSKAFAAESLDAAERTRRSASGAVSPGRSSAQEERRQKFDAATSAIRSRSGIDTATWDMLDKLFDSLYTSRMAWRQGGGDAAILKLESDLQEQVAAMPVEQRAEAEPELMKLADGLKGLRDGAETRKKFGDAAVDLALRYGGDLETLRDELFRLSLRRR